MGLFDVHAHLTHERLLPDVDDILARAAAAGVSSIVANGLNPGDNQAVLDLAARTAGGPVTVRPALGFYPVDTVMPELLALGHEYPRTPELVTAEQGVAWLRDHVEQAFAVGEIGLDGYWVPEELWERQEQAFRQMVALAMEADKPIIIHTRKRERRCFEVLSEMGARRVDWHCFGGRVKLARRIAEAGHFLSIPANARRSQSFTRMIETVPRSQLLLETDCPYLGPERGASSEPAHVAGTARYMGEVWSATEDEVQSQLSENFERLFGVAP